jgi:hypothetical protein
MPGFIPLVNSRKIKVKCPGLVCSEHCHLEPLGRMPAQGVGDFLILLHLIPFDMNELPACPRENFLQTRVLLSILFMLNDICSCHRLFADFQKLKQRIRPHEN